MQKYLWGGAALMVMGAAAVYVSVDYALRHPESVLARAGTMAVAAGLNPNPLSALNAGARGAKAARQGEGQGETVPGGAVKPEGAGAAAADRGEEETIEPIQVEAVPLPTV